MDKTKAQDICNYVVKNVFGTNRVFLLKETKNKFAIDIPQANEVKCSLSNTQTWSFSSKEDKVASQIAIMQRFKKDEWMRKKQPLQTISAVLKEWQEINYLTGEKYINAKDVIESDGIYNSSSVYQSVSIFDSKNIVCSYKLFDCNYMLASRDNSSCTLGIRIKESIYCSSGFEIYWSNKVSNSMFIHDGFDLFECLFCSHLRSKKYCIANMQFTKEEYLKIKPLVIDWILKN